MNCWKGFALLMTPSSTEYSAQEQMLFKLWRLEDRTCNEHMYCIPLLLAPKNRDSCEVDQSNVAFQRKKMDLNA